MDQPRIIAIARFAERAEQLAVENVGKADHGVERRAQLMAHIGEERVLARLASRPRRACASSASCALCSEMSRVTATMPGRPSGSPAATAAAHLGPDITAGAASSLAPIRNSRRAALIARDRTAP